MPKMNSAISSTYNYIQVTTCLLSELGMHVDHAFSTSFHKTVSYIGTGSDTGIEEI